MSGKLRNCEVPPIENSYCGLSPTSFERCSKTFSFTVGNFFFIILSSILWCSGRASCITTEDTPPPCGVIFFVRRNLKNDCVAELNN